VDDGLWQLWTISVKVIIQFIFETIITSGSLFQIEAIGLLKKLSRWSQLLTISLLK
jgi:hypothetical protein